MGNLVLNYIGLDSWSRPVYENDGMFFVDVDSREHRKPEICTKYNNDFDGEPDTPIEYIERYKNLKLEFVPKRYVD